MWINVCDWAPIFELDWKLKSSKNEQIKRTLKIREILFKVGDWISRFGLSSEVEEYKISWRVGNEQITSHL